MSCNKISINELAKITPLNPSIVNKNTNPINHKLIGLYFESMNCCKSSKNCNTSENCN